MVILLYTVCTPAKTVACCIIAVVLQPSLRILYLHELVVGIIGIFRQSLPVCLAQAVSIAVISISVVTHYAARTSPKSSPDTGQVLVQVIGIIRTWTLRLYTAFSLLQVLYSSLVFTLTHQC